MKAEIFNTLRGPLDAVILKDGFIWKYGMYIHVDFQNEWIVCICPRVYWGSEYEIQYYAEALGNTSPEWIRTLSRFGSTCASSRYLVSQEKRPSKAIREITEESFLNDLNDYQNTIRDILKRIHTLEDVVHFQQQYYPYKNHIICEDWFNILMYIGKHDEAAELISPMRESILFLIDMDESRLNDNLHRLSKQLFPKSMKRTEETYKKSLVEDNETTKRRLRGYQYALTRIDIMEQQIRNHQYNDFIQQMDRDTKDNKEQIMKMFSAKERTVMETWINK